MSLGNFEWCVNSEALGPLFESVTSPYALVLGCGTSQVEHLLQWIPLLHCVDNDEIAIREQEERLAQCRDISFEVCDLCMPGALNHHKCNCIIDKGTLDYLLCQDPLRSSEALVNIHAAMPLGGLYIVITIHPEALIRDILAVYGFCLDKSVHFQGCTGMIWRKEADLPNDCTDAQRRVTDAFFKAKPLTEEKKFPTLTDPRNDDPDRKLSLEEAYDEAIPSELKLEYSFEMFCEDLSVTHAAALERGSLDAAEMREFLELNQ